MKTEERKVFKDEDEVKIIAELMRMACKMKATRIEVDGRKDDAGIYFYITGYRELWAVFPKEKKDGIIKRIKGLANIKVEGDDGSTEDISSNGLFSATIDGGLKKTFFVKIYPAKQYEERLAMGLNWGAPNKFEKE
jgi:hypothetical protein